MPDKIKEAFEATKDNGIFLDEEDFRSSLSKEPKAVFELFKADKKYADLFLDYDDFENSLDLKKKDFQGFSQELPKPAMPSGEKFTQGIGLGVKPISSTASPSASKQPKSTIPSESTDGKTNLDYLREINNLYSKKINTSQQRVNAKRELLSLQPEVEDAYSKIEELSAIYNDENLSAQERNEAAKSYNILLEEFQPMKSRYDQLVLSYNDLVGKDKQQLAELKEIDNKRQLQLKKEFSISKDLLDKTSKGFVDAAAGISGIFNTLGLSGDPENPEIQEEVREQTKQNIDKIRNFGNSLITQETPEEFKSIFEGDFSPRKLAYITSQAISSTIPTVAAGLFTGGAGTALAGAGMGFNESKDILKEAGLNDAQAEWASLGLSIPLGLLEEYGAGDVVKILSSPIVKRKVANELVKNLAGKQITKELLFVESKKSLGKVIAENAGGILNTGVKESLTEIGQGTLQEIAKQSAQEYTGLDPDQEIPFEEYAKSFAMQRAEEGIGGFLGGTTLSAAGKGVELGLNKFQSNFTPTVYSQAIEFKDPEKLQEFQEDLEGDIAQGLITPEQAQEAIQNVQAIIEADNLIPNTIADNDIRANAVNLIIEKNNIERDIEGKEKSLVTPLTERVKEIEAQLVAMSKGEKIEEKLPNEIINEQSKIGEPIGGGVAQEEVKYNIDEARQQFIKDNEIEAFQKKFGYQPYNPFESLPDGVYETILRVEDNTPTSLTAIEEASNWLYSQYKMLEAKKVADTRDMTIPQIDEVLSELEGAITELENFKNKLYEESGQAKGGQDTTPVQAVGGQTGQGVRVGEEIATPTQEVVKSENKASEPSKSDKNYQDAQNINSIVSKENPDASVLIQPKGDNLALTAIYVGKGKRRGGIGSKALETIKREAKKLGKKVVLDATNELDQETDLKRLGNFYERNGFKKVGENTYEYDPKNEASSGDTSARTDNTGAEVGDIASVTDKGESGKEAIAEEEVDAVKKGKKEFPKNVLAIAEETGLSPQQIENTYKKYDGSKDIEEITIEDYKNSRATGDKAKLEVSAKAFDALLQQENAKTSTSPTAKKNAEKSLKEADEKALKEASKIMEHINEIRAKLQESGIIKSTSCKWGK